MPTSLERALPTHHFDERHSRLIAADIDTVWAALASLRMDQLSVTRPLVAIRHLGRPAPSPAQPLLTGGPVTIFELDTPSYAVWAGRSGVPGGCGRSAAPWSPWRASGRSTSRAG